jgi:hypothetical protein
LIILNGFFVTSHSIAQFSISSGISFMSCGNLSAGIIFSTFGNGASYVDQLKVPLSVFQTSFPSVEKEINVIFPFSLGGKGVGIGGFNGKYSFATVSLYQNGLILLGKNSHHSHVVIICSIIFGTSISYSCFVYCLFRMQ